MPNYPNIFKDPPDSLSFQKFLSVSLVCHVALVLAIFANHAFNKPVQKDTIPVNLVFEIPSNFEPSIPKSFETQLVLKDQDKIITMGSKVSDELAERRLTESVSSVKPGIILEQAEVEFISAKQDAEQLASSKPVQFSHPAKTPEAQKNLTGQKVKSTEVKVISRAKTLNLDSQIFVKSDLQSESVDQDTSENRRSDMFSTEQPFKNDKKLENYQFSSQENTRNQHVKHKPVSILSKNSPPIYPRASKRLGEEGVVKVRLDISVVGTTTHATIIQTSGFERLDNAALRAVKNWKFEPATRDGRPIETSIDIPVRFNIQ